MPRFRRLALFILSILIIFPVSAYADDNPTTKISLEPSSLRFALNPGDHYPGSFKVRNLGSTPYDIQLYVEAYQVANDYSTLFGIENNFTQISRWIAFDKSEHHLEPKSIITVNFFVDVPPDAPAGGQYAAIFAQIGSGSTTGQSINIDRRVGVLIYSTIAGDTVRAGHVNFLSPGFLQLSSSLNLRETAVNEGNVDFDSATHLVLKKLFTGEIVIETDTTPHIILPHTSRELEYALSDIPPGFYELTRAQNIFGETSEHKYTLLIFPLPYLIFFLLAVLSLLIFIIRRFRIRRRRRTILREQSLLEAELARLKKENERLKSSEEPSPTTES
jgi:hypothetical protein